MWKKSLLFDCVESALTLDCAPEKTDSTLDVKGASK